MASEKDPLFLQVKEARASVLEDYAGKSIYPNHGQRVVNGCRLMQSASDFFLGWSVGPAGRQFYVRQLRDMKIKMLVRAVHPQRDDAIRRTVRLDAGASAARAAASLLESRDILATATNSTKAIADFSMAYADQSERDHKILTKAAHEGRLKVVHVKA